MLQSGTIDPHVWDVELADVLSQPDLFDDLDWDAIAPDPIFPEAKQPKAIGPSLLFLRHVMERQGQADQHMEGLLRHGELPRSPGHDVGTTPTHNSKSRCLPMVLRPTSSTRWTSTAPLPSSMPNKDKVQVWWDSGSQAAELVTSGEVDYALIYSGRVAYSKDVGMTYNQGISVLNYLAVTKGIDAETKAAAMKFFHEMTVAENELKAVETIAYSGPSEGLDALLSDEQRKVLPSSVQNRAVQIPINSQWWTENRTAIDKRWTEFRANL